MSQLSELSQAVITGDSRLAERLIQQALDEGIEARAIYRQGLIPGMDTVGKKMQAGEYYIPEVLLSAQVMKRALAILQPILRRSPAAGSTGRVVIGTVMGDLHDIGKNLVIIMLEGAGFEVTDLGVNVPPERFLAAARQTRADVIGLSALLSITMLNMKEIIDAVMAADLRSRVKVIIGGAPVTQRFADEIGADGYAPDAASAVDLIRLVLTRGEDRNEKT